MTLYLEDFEAGTQIDLGTCVPSEEEIVAFGRRFDPQPFHIDPDAAREHYFGGIVASGWHTASMFHRLWVEGMLLDCDTLGGMGIDELRTPHPVRPGDELRGTLHIVEVRPSRLKLDRGTIVVRGELHNQDGVLVLSFLCAGRFGRRPACA